MPDLILLRLLAPRAFRGVRFFLWLLFLLTFFVLASGIIIGLFAPPSPQGDLHRSVKTSHTGKSR